jgi:exodeoxyribonuclease VII large subunit
MDTPVLSVSELLRSVRDTLERRFPLLWVRGELSNLSRAASGHCYFTLKDRGAQVDCVMFRSRLSALDWEPRGRFQLTLENLRRAGAGPLYERFLRLKETLERDGLFDAAAKRELPAHPRAIGVLTSLGAAALRDVLTTLARRNPSIPVIVYPVPVQGAGAAERIAAMLARAGRRAECDVLLLVRGGGSIEDLWQFNEEAVARAIRACPLPVVVGVGHETDVTIADFAADRRAATPTAAAELAGPSRAELLGRVAECARCVSREMRRRLQYAAQAADGWTRRLVHPAERLRAHLGLVGQLSQRLAYAWLQHLRACQAQLAGLQASLRSLDPSAVLERGYSITRTAQGEVLRDAARAREGEIVHTTLARGRLESEVKKRDNP